MKLEKALAAAALLTLSATSFAGATLTFEGVGDLNAVNTFYSAQNISFTGNNLSYVSALADGSGLFTDAPSGVTAVGLSASNSSYSFIINVLNGFTSSLELYFGTQGTASGLVSIFSAANGAGTKLASFTLSSISQDGCFDDNFGDVVCNWASISKAFEGTAYSIVVTGVQGSTDPRGNLFLDNITLGGSTPSLDVPEPASLALLMAGIGAAALNTRRRKSGTAA